MADARIITPKVQIIGKRSAIFTPGFTPLPANELNTEANAWLLTESGLGLTTERYISTS